MSKTSIVATIGPVSNNPALLLALKQAGMTVARLNGSHGDLAWHQATIQLIRETLPDLPILLDIPGRKIRTIQLKVEPSFNVGDKLILTTDLSHDGSRKVPVNYPLLHEKLAAGIRIFADDGTLSFIVEKVEGPDIVVRAESAGTLKSRKGINVPGIDLGQQLVTARDREMLAFAQAAGVDFIGISFVESAAHIQAIRAHLSGVTPRIVAKVESQGGLDQLEEIAASADVIMIDRGDLSVETGIDQVSINQKRIIEAARHFGSPVIVATELLHSMIESPLPTKAEIGDITNAVLDGAAAVMLSGETAVGRYPVEAVARLRNIVTLVEEHRFASPRRTASQPDLAGQSDLRQATRALAHSLPISKVLVFSRSGHAARLVSMAGIRQPILAVGHDPALVRSWNLLPGTQGVHLADTEQGTQPGVGVLRTLWEQGHLDTADTILIVQASNDESKAAQNLLQTVRLEALIAEQGWPLREVA